MSIFQLKIKRTNTIEFLLNCSWFESFPWDELKNRSLEAPLKRPIKDNVDLSNFDEYPLDSDEPPDDLSGWDIHF